MGRNQLSIPKLPRGNRGNLGMGQVISSHILLNMWLLSMLGLKSIHVSKMDPKGRNWDTMANAISLTIITLHNFHFFLGILQDMVLLYALWFLNPLRDRFFQREHKHMFTFCVILPHWYNAGSWNPSSNTTRTYLFYIVNIMVADVLAT